MEKLKYPYDDDEMYFDYQRRMYILTEKALLNAGVDLRSRITAHKGANPDVMISYILRRASTIIYGYIHAHNINNQLQDRIISTVPSVRPILKDALVNQAVYMSIVGDLTLSVKDEERNKAIDAGAKVILETEIEGLGTTILFAGGV